MGPQSQNPKTPEERAKDIGNAVGCMIGLIFIILLVIVPEIRDVFVNFFRAPIGVK